MEAPKKRISLTKAQLQTETGLELLSICQSATADGRLEDPEIHALQAWIAANSNSDLPSIRHLSSTLDRVLADGVITPEERQSVAKAIEAILPLEERKLAAALRRQIEQEERQSKKAAEAQAKQEAREEKERNRPLDFADFMVAGTRHENRCAIIQREVRAGSSVFLRREADNPHSKDAIAVVTTRGSTIGYVPAEWALDIAPLLDDGALHAAAVKKVLEYESGPIPVIVARFYAKDATVRGVYSQDQSPQKAAIDAKGWPDKTTLLAGAGLILIILSIIALMK